MRISSAKSRAWLAASLLVLVLLLCLTPESQAQRLRVRVNDTTASPGQTNSVVSIYLTNTSDQIAAFTLHLMLTRPDIAHFQTDFVTKIDTTYWKEWCCTEYLNEQCVDSARDTCAVDFPDIDPWDFFVVDTAEVSVGSFDTVGTLISGWEMVEARSVSTGDLGLDIKLTAIADRSSVQGTHPPINPQQGGLLFRLLADIFPISPAVVDRTVGILIDDARSYFSFSTPAGQSIGWISIEIPDTNYYICTQPVPPPGSGCYPGGWVKVHSWECPEGGCDSVGIDTVSRAILDTTQVKLYDGSIEVGNFVCGDCNGNGEITIGDVALLIDNLFISGAPIEPVERCNNNCSTESPTELSIGDVAALIDHLFISQMPLCCH